MPHMPPKTKDKNIEDLLKEGFRFGKSARYWLGEKLCRRCRFIHPPHYTEDTCTLCGKRLAKTPKATGRRKSWEQLYPWKYKRIDIDALLQDT